MKRFFAMTLTACAWSVAAPQFAWGQFRGGYELTDAPGVWRGAWAGGGVWAGSVNGLRNRYPGVSPELSAVWRPVWAGGSASEGSFNGGIRFPGVAPDSPDVWRGVWEGGGVWTGSFNGGFNARNLSYGPAEHAWYGHYYMPGHPWHINDPELSLWWPRASPGFTPMYLTSKPDATATPEPTPKFVPLTPPATPRLAPGSASANGSADTAQIIVRLPHADGEVWLNGRKITQSGTARSFTTPPLQPGQSYSYQVEVAWRQDGRLVTESQSVSVSAGSAVALNFGPVLGPTAASGR